MGDVLVQGLLVGGVYSLIALGFVLVFKASRVLNLAYGEIFAILAYFLFWLLDSVGISPWLAIPILFVCGGAIGMVVERFAIRPLMNQSFLALLMMTLMLGFLFKGVIVLIWGGDSFVLPFTPSGTVNIGTLQIVPAAGWAFVVAIVLFLLLSLLFRYTKLGLAMRVVAGDHAVAQSLGIRVRQIFSVSWVISGTFAAVCAVLVGMVWMVTADIGALAMMKGLPVLLLGGLDSIPGALVGGLIIGLVESLGGYWAAPVREIIPWVIMLLILLIRPYGLFGQKRIERI